MTGTVFDNGSMEPVAGIRIVIPEVNCSTFTNSTGQFLIATSLPSSLSIHATGTDYHSKMISDIFLSKETTYVDIHLHPLTSISSLSKKTSKPGIFSICGTVLDSISGRPLVGIPVVINKFSHTFTNLNGNFLITGLPREKLHLTIDATGYKTFTISSIDTSTANPLKINLIKLPSSLYTVDTSSFTDLYGVLIDAMKGGPVAGALLTIDSSAIYYSNQNGEYNISKLKTGNHHLRIESEFYDTLTMEFTISGIDTLIFSEFNLIPVSINQPIGTISGHIQSEDGNPVQSSMIVMEHPYKQTSSDTTGNFSLLNLPDTEISLIILKNGYKPYLIKDLTPDTVISITLSVDSSSDSNNTREQFLENIAALQRTVISGSVIEHHGEFPVSNAVVSFSGIPQILKTEADGRFQIDSIKPGICSITVSAEGYDSVTINNFSVTLESQPLLVIKLHQNSTLPPSKESRLWGKVTFSSTGEPFAGVMVSINETRFSTFTDPNGIFRFSGLPEGYFVLSATISGYMQTNIPEIQIIKGSTIKQDLFMQKDTTRELQQMFVAEAAQKNSLAGMLKERQNNFTVSDGMSKDDMQKTGSSDAAEAMSKITGVTIIDGKYVYIRGMGERYVYSTLNDMEIPNPDPDVNAVPLDIFPTSLIDNLTVNKTFSPDKPGNFSGGNVNIQTKAIPDSLVLSFSAKIGTNSQVFKNDNFLTYNGGKLDWLGFDDGTRELPEEVKEKNLIPDYSLAQNNPVLAQILDSKTKAFSNTFNYKTETALPDMGLSFSYGNKFHLSEYVLGANIAITYSKTSPFTEDDTTARYSASDNADYSTKLEYTHLRLSDQSIKEVKWGALSALTFTNNDNHTINGTYMYLRNADDRTLLLFGKVPKIDNKDLLSVSLEYTQRNLNVMQLEGKHFFSPLWTELLWRSAYSKTAQNQPDLRQYLVTMRAEPGVEPYDFSIDGGQPRPSRYYRNLEEDNFQLFTDLVFHIDGTQKNDNIVKLGYSYQKKNRSYRERYFTFESRSPGSSISNLNGDMDYYFSDQNTGLLSERDTVIYNRKTRKWDTLYIATLGVCATDFPNESSNYDSKQKIPASYGMINFNIRDRLKLSAGIRYERTTLILEPDSISNKNGINKKYSEWLPSLNTMFSISDDMNIRFTLGKSVARPSSREIAPFSSYDIENSGPFVGNPDLTYTEIHNFDLRYEWIKRINIFSASLFFKHLKNPIEKVIIDDNNAVQFQNVDDGILLGSELEMRIGLKELVPVLDGFNAGFNCAFIYSRVKLGGKELSVKRSWDRNWPDTRPLQGQSPWVFNFDITYDIQPWGLNAGLFFNVKGPRISAVSGKEAPDVYEQPVPVLVGNINKKFNNGLSVKTTLKNLLNPYYKSIYTYHNVDYTYSKYTKGRSYSLEIGYSFK